MAAEAAAHGPDIASVVILLGSAVVAVPVFKRLGLGSVLGYLAAGLAIGPFGLALFEDPETILHVAELGVVMFLFIIGLEMEPARLWSMRRDIFGLGLAQVLVAMAVLSLVGIVLGYPLAASLIAGTGFVLTSTAIVMQLLAERGDIGKPMGQKIIAILLLEDLAIVPLLAAAGKLLMLVKPQFELQPEHIGKGGLVKDAASYTLVQQRIAQACADHGLQMRDFFDSPITGGDGNREFFVWACR